MEGSDRSARHKFCFQLYVSHYVRVSTFEGERLRRARERREQGVLLASATPKKTGEKGRIKKERKEYR